MAKYRITGTVFFVAGFNVGFDAASEVEARQLARSWVQDNARDYAENSTLQEICVEVIESDEE